MPWLLKAEPDSRIVKGQDVKYTIDDLKDEKIGTWDGVRNNEARKHLMAMKVGDRAFFYRSNCKEPAIVGTMRISKESYPDSTAKDPKAPYYDARNPDRWVVVDVEYRSHLPAPVLLSDIKRNSKLKDMQLIKRSRLSVSPVTDAEWREILAMAGVEENQDNGNTDENNVNHNDENETNATEKNFRDEQGVLPKKEKGEATKSSERKRRRRHS